MKFTRYFEDTQTPEWKRAYIDYRQLKERLRAIKGVQNRVQDGMHSPAYQPEFDTYSASQVNHHAGGSMLSVIRSDSGGNSSGTSSVHLPIEKRDFTFVPSRARADAPGSSRPVLPRHHSLHRTVTSQSGSPPSPGGVATTPPPRNPKITIPQFVVRQPSNRSHLAPPSPGGETATTDGRQARTNFNFLSRQWTETSQIRQSDRVPPSPGAAPSSVTSRMVKTVSHIMDPLRRQRPWAELSLPALFPLLSLPEVAFFNALDGELQKVEAFYIDREKAMKVRSRELDAQLRELDQHRKLFENPGNPRSWMSFFNPLRIFGLWHNHGLPSIAIPRKNSDAAPSPEDEKKLEEKLEHDHLDPKEYLTAKRKLKKAVLEHYRGLEMLHNYRILNLYAIRRVLVKFEKVTKIPVQRAYMEERVEKSALFSDDTLQDMINAMQSLFATSFAEGNRKEAITRLRAGIQYKSHHNSTFCSGIAIGSALAALGSGIAHVFDRNIRNEIPGWDGLLFIYGVFAVPVLFALLVGLNLLVWARSRINYVFIFELDLRTRLDHREYIQTPSVILAALCYAFWLSFARIGAPTVSPTVWPVVWLAFAAILMVDPIPILFKPSRYWLIKTIGKLLKSGTKRVEFTDFWMGDQFCSLSFTLSNIPLVACVYSRGLDSDWRKCGNTSNLWPLAFVLAALPFLVRFVQSLRRFHDSQLRTHLINAGKYGSGVINYLFYFLWRHRGSHYDSVFVLWCLSNTFYATYALIWDFLMDWSIFRRHTSHFLLREQLVYTNHISLYYLAIATNTLIRFLWIFYIPAKPDAMLRSFSVGLLEILRRTQWNFYRLENEQIGNTDSYRAIREVPLPYSLEGRGDIEEPDGE